MAGAGPSFSVIIAVYNGAATIRRAIDSVLAQTYAPSQLIVVDDGSSDGTAEAVRSYGDRVRYIYHANAGVSAARNRGAEVASGDWLAFLDADDVYYPDRLRLHAEWIARDPGLDFLTGDQEYRRPDGSLIRRSMESTAAGMRLLQRAQGRREVVMDGADLESFIEDHFGDTHTLSVPRRSFLELGGYPAGRKVAEDVHFLIRLAARAHRVGVVCEPLAIYYVHPDSATRSDPLRSQVLTVETLATLKDSLGDAPPAVQRGYLGRMRLARLNLAYALLREGRRLAALAAVLPIVAAAPGLRAARDVFSILRGLKANDCNA